MLRNIQKIKPATRSGWCGGGMVSEVTRWETLEEGPFEQRLGCVEIWASWQREEQWKGPKRKPVCHKGWLCGWKEVSKGGTKR
jgi:hypothetical protein